MTTRETREMQSQAPARGVDEMLARSVPLAREIARQLCRTPSGHDDCGALHGVWPQLRRLGLAAEPARHAAFYSDALRGQEGARVLVAGCADWGMLELVASTRADRLRSLDVTVADRCPTPLLLCAWYGAEIGLPVRTVVTDLTTWQGRERFDVVCTHSLLTYPDLEGRRRLVRSWADALTPGGAVVTVSRLATEPSARIDDARARRLGDLALERCNALGIVVDVHDLRARVERYARAQVAHPVGTAEDLRRLFESAGFEIARLDVRELPGPVGARDAIGGAARTGTYAEIVAVRR
jgi:SAM-dependent methyltransferase